MEKETDRNIENELAEVQKMAEEISLQRKITSQISRFFTLGIVIIICVFLFSMYQIFTNLDKEKVGECLRKELKVLTPTMSKIAFRIAKDVYPVYMREIKEEFDRMGPEFAKEGEKQMLLFTQHVHNEVSNRLIKRMTLIFKKYESQIMREAPELKDKDKVASAFTNLAHHMQDQLNQIFIHGIFSEQITLMRDVRSKLESFPIRASDENTDELCKRLVGILGKIIEYKLLPSKESQQNLPKNR